MTRRPVKKKGRLTQGKGFTTRTAGPVQRSKCVRVRALSQLLYAGNMDLLHVITFSIHVSLILSLPGGGVPRGGAATLRNRRVPPPPGRRRGQGVITGLAARRPGALLKRVGTLNRAAVTQVMETYWSGDMWDALLSDQM